MTTGLLTRRLRECSWFKNLLLLCEHYFNIIYGLAVNKAVHTKTLIQGDQKVSVHPIITVQKHAKYFKQFHSLTVIT
jgi:hypothetical protein